MDRHRRPDGDPWAIGRERARRDTGGFSYRNAVVVGARGRIAAALIGYALPDRPEPIADTMPAMFVPMQELENLVPGSWYVNVLAAYPDPRGKGRGRPCSASPTDRRSGNRPAQHHRLRRQHRRAAALPAVRVPGRARRKKAKEHWQTAGTEWILLTKPL